MALKKKLVKYIRDKFTQQWLRNQGDPAKVMSIIQRITPNALMIGFCRRFATYKRAHLLFTDLDRLEKIVDDSDRPVLFFFSGKAHPADGARPGPHQAHLRDLPYAAVSWARSSSWRTMTCAWPAASSAVWISG